MCLTYQIVLCMCLNIFKNNSYISELLSYISEIEVLKGLPPSTQETEADFLPKGGPRIKIADWVSRTYPINNALSTFFAVILHVLLFMYTMYRLECVM